jgi:hypothetical protein
MPDTWEIVNGLNPDRNDANEDLDLDGMINLHEYLAGTDPQNPSSVLRVDVASFSGSTATLQFLAVAGKSYTVQYRNSLSTGSWQKLADVPVQAASQIIVVQDPAAGVAGQRFYRLITPQSP